MGFFDRLFKRENLTEGWVADPQRRLSVDLDELRFCGVALGGDYSLLAFLGPCEPATVRGLGLLSYPQFGLEIFVDKQKRISSVDINLVVGKKQGRYPGQWLFQGISVEIDAQCGAKQIKAMLGNPEDVEEEDYLFYQRAGGELMFNYTVEGLLDTVSLSALS